MSTFFSASTLTLILLLGGCITPVAPRNNTIVQGETVADVHEQQVLDNVAKFVCDPYALPSFALAVSGTSGVMDQCGGSATPSVIASGFEKAILAVSGQRQKQSNWTLTPVTDPRKLELMRCAYQRSVSACTGMGESTCCPDCRKRFNKFYTGREVSQKIAIDGDQEVKSYLCGPDGRLANLVPPPCEDPAICSKCQGAAGPCESIPKPDANGNVPATGKGKVTSECLDSECWFCCGCKKCVPKNCGFVGQYCGTYVWVPPGPGRDHLAKLTLAILDYAVHDDTQLPSKDVTVYLKDDGALPTTKDDAAYVVKTTMGIDDRNKSILDSEKLEKAKKLIQTKKRLLDNLSLKSLGKNYGAASLDEQSTVQSHADVMELDREIQQELNVPAVSPLPQERTPMPNTNLLFLNQQLNTVR